MCIRDSSFINPIGGGKIIMDFSGKELVCGEPDASSFPSGGLRATFEARGYSAWDPTAFAFIKDGSLCIPTVFCSYGGAALDKKTPLLRSNEAVSREAVKLLHLFDSQKDVSKVTPQVGPEQEYFLIDRELYLKREDLRPVSYTHLFWLGVLPGENRFSPVSVESDQLTCLPEPLTPAKGFSCSRQTRPWRSATFFIVSMTSWF